MENRFRRSMRFIPTYVGHTSLVCSDRSSKAVHPHIRGAYGIYNRNHSSSPGSSPHTWGIQGVNCPGLSKIRFIPTYVGHTGKNSTKQIRSTVHPHIRGAYDRYVCHASITPGSSPHTWGIRPWPRHSAIIPSVHPHIRGAYLPGLLGQIKQGGSSPHTWGILYQKYCRRDINRFIPTYVGHTVK